jgi:quinoprotein glucose dehydrogenase
MHKLIRAAFAAMLPVVIAAAAQGAEPAAATAAPAELQWSTYGHDKGQARFSPLAQITPANVGQLAEAWVYRMRPPGAEMYSGGRTFARTAEPAGSNRQRFALSEVTPLVVDNQMFITTPYNRIVALDATTGTELWSAPGQGSTRGVEYWPGDARHVAAIFYASGTSLHALEAKTGKPVTTFGDNGVLEGKAGTIGTFSSPPIIWRNVIISQAANPAGDGRDGDVRGFDAATGRQLWRFATVPEKGQKGYDTWPASAIDARRGVHVWGLMSVDEQRGLVYFPVNAPQWDRYGGDRPGSNLYSSSIVALDAKTGRYRWHFQIVHHDIWDFDPGAAPTLFEVKHGRKTIPAIALISKSGLVFILDRTNGKPIYGIEEREVPKSDVPEERTWPTQPFPIKPAPVSRQSMSMADIATVTPELEANCRALIEKYNIGMGGPYLPPGYKRPTVNFPGTIGSANWGGMSFNPQLGLLFVNSHDLGQITGLDVKGSPREVIGVAGAGAGTTANVPYDMAGLLGRFKDLKTNMPCNAPPWGSLTAIDVNTGEIAWKSVLGVTDTLPADKQATGRPNLGGSITTAGGLVFVGATDDGRLRAFDAKTGAEAWTTKLPAPNHSVPISYQGRDGRQFLVLPATGGGFLEDPATDDALIAFALPAAGASAGAPGTRPRGAGGSTLIPQAGGNPAAAPLLFSEHWNGLPMAQPITHEHLVNQQLALHLYGDVAAIRKTQHPTENYLYTGESVTNWGLALGDPKSYWDLTGNARIKLRTRNSGYRLLHVMIKTSEGKWFVSEEGNGESTAWVDHDYVFGDLHWRDLAMADVPTNASNRRQPDPARQPLVANAPARPDLAKVDEVGFTDLMPGGWILSSSRVQGIELYGKAVARQP